MDLQILLVNAQKKRKYKCRQTKRDPVVIQIETTSNSASCALEQSKKTMQMQSYTCRILLRRLSASAAIPVAHV